MDSSPDGVEFRRRVQRIETLIREIDDVADGAARARARELIRAVLELHGAGLARLLEHCAAVEGESMITALAGDELVGSLLLLHGLHPLDAETRVRQALETVKPRARSHGGTVELLGIVEGAVHLRVSGCWDSSSPALPALKQAIEDAICVKAPDVTVVDVEIVTLEPAEDRSRLALPVVAGTLRTAR
jgi:Fe-S cluster biogenesis protein NfuA